MVMTEKEKMEANMWYDANYDKELLELRVKAEDLCFELNNIRPSETEKRSGILKELFPNMEENCVVLSPIYTDYGFYTKIGHDTFINHNAYLMDGCGITIGNNTIIGAGSVVTKDIPANVVAAGNPCRVLRPITDDDRIKGQ